ncbi:disease resistance protein Pik-2-like [Setaria viridis]|uniref:disease resistance protein Pik-2-like n=1 Tax=Setaria viridis TaxID=4556 RepID=UPI003B3A9A11
MADSAVSFVLGRLGEFVVKEARALQEVGNDVVLLKDKLQWLHTFVQQADHRRRCEGNTYMDVWVQQTREVALDVEDVLDEFMRRVDLQQGLPAWRKWLKFLRSCASQISVRRELSGRIAMIRARLDQISDHRSAYITDYSSSLTRESSSPSITTVDGWCVLTSL